MRVCIVGDMHWRLELPYSSAIPDGRESEWNNVLDKIVKTADTCDAVVLLGDVFNSKHNHSSVIHGLITFLKRLGDKEIYTISGNHCRYGEKTALDFLQKVDQPNWHVYTKVTEGVQIGDTKATFIPFMTPATLGVETKEEAEVAILDKLGSADIAFCHHAMKGAKTSGFFEGEIVLDKDKMESLFGLTVYGHIHQAERLSDKVLGTGSIFNQEVNEYGKSIWVWDTETKKTGEVPLPCRGIYKVVWEAPQWHIPKEKDALSSIPNNSIVKCYVTDRTTDIDTVRNVLQRFDASIIIEQYPNERSKAHFEEGGLDLSVDSMLKRYSEAKGLSYDDLVSGFALIK